MLCSVLSAAMIIGYRKAQSYGVSHRNAGQSLNQFLS